MEELKHAPKSTTGFWERHASVRLVENEKVSVRVLAGSDLVEVMIGGKSCWTLEAFF